MPDSKQRLDVHVHFDSCDIGGIGAKLDEFIAQVYPKLDFIISQGEKLLAIADSADQAKIDAVTALLEQARAALAQSNERLNKITEENK